MKVGYLRVGGRVRYININHKVQVGNGLGSKLPSLCRLKLMQAKRVSARELYIGIKRIEGTTRSRDQGSEFGSRGRDGFGPHGAARKSY